MALRMYSLQQQQQQKTKTLNLSLFLAYVIIIISLAHLVVLADIQYPSPEVSCITAAGLHAPVEVDLGASPCEMSNESAV